MAAVGRSSLRLRTQQEIIERELPHNFSISDARESIVEKSASRDQEVNSGYFYRRIDMERLQDFLISRDVFVMENERYIPVKISGGGLVQSDDDGPPALSFTVERPPIKYYTPFLGNTVQSGDDPLPPSEFLMVNSTFLRINR